MGIVDLPPAELIHSILVLTADGSTKYPTIACRVIPRRARDPTPADRYNLPTLYTLVTNTPLDLVGSDRVVWKDAAGTVHQLKVTDFRDLGGRGECWKIEAEESFR